TVGVAQAVVDHRTERRVGPVTLGDVPRPQLLGKRPEAPRVDHRADATVCAVDDQRIADILEIEQLLARYAVGMTKNDVDAVIDVFTPDGTYSAFGDTYALADFPRLVEAAPKGLFMTGTPAIE